MRWRVVMKYVYHGSMTADLTIIKPGISTHMKSGCMQRHQKLLQQYFYLKGK